MINPLLFDRLNGPEVQGLNTKITFNFILAATSLIKAALKFQKLDTEKNSMTLCSSQTPSQFGAPGTEGLTEGVRH